VDPADPPARLGRPDQSVQHQYLAYRNKAAETPDPGAPTIIVTGHPVMGYIRIKQRGKR